MQTILNWYFKPQTMNLVYPHRPNWMKKVVWDTFCKLDPIELAKGQPKGMRYKYWYNFIKDWETSCHNPNYQECCKNVHHNYTCPKYQWYVPCHELGCSYNEHSEMCPTSGDYVKGRIPDDYEFKEGEKVLCIGYNTLEYQCWSKKPRTTHHTVYRIFNGIVPDDDEINEMIISANDYKAACWVKCTCYSWRCPGYGTRTITELRSKKVVLLLEK